MSVNDFLPVATAVGANVQTQAVYAGSAPQTQGQQPGLAVSAFNNKALRQATTMAAVIGMLINTAGVDALDDGNLTTKLNGVTAAIRTASQGAQVWSSTQAYLTDDITQYNGVIYVALANNTNSAPPSANWKPYDQGLLSLSVAGNTNVNLTARQSGFQIMKFTGALTGNISVLGQPVNPGEFIVVNSTTGNFTLQVGLLSGGTEITIPQGFSQLLYWDGSNTYAVSAPISVTNGVPSNLTTMATVATTSGTAIDVTGIPSWAKRVTIAFNNTSTTGTNDYQIQIGNGTLVTTGYTSNSSSGSTADSNSTGFRITSIVASAGTTMAGLVTLLNMGNGIWIEAGNLAGTSNSVNISGGSLNLGTSIDRLRLTTLAGTDTFDAGSISVTYEG